MNKSVVWKCMLVLPFLLSILSVYMESFYVSAAAILLIYILVDVIPFCHKKENVWLFLMSFYTMPAINILILQTIFRKISFINFVVLEIGSRALYNVIVINVNFLMLSMELLIISLIGRLIWRKQEELLPYEMVDMEE